jgi:hypothetical protein
LQLFFHGIAIRVQWSTKNLLGCSIRQTSLPSSNLVGFLLLSTLFLFDVLLPLDLFELEMIGDIRMCDVTSVVLYLANSTFLLD